MRLILPFTLIAAHLACKAPIDINEPPSLRIVTPQPGETVNEGTVFVVTIEVSDGDNDPLTITATDSVAGQVYMEEGVEGGGEALTLEIAGLGAGEHVLTIVADDGRTDGARSADLGFIMNGAPTAPTITVTPEFPTPSDDLVGELTTPSSDPEGSEVGYFWEWRKDDRVFASGSTFPATLPNSQTNKGDTWVLRVEAYEAASGARVDGGNAVFVETTVPIDNEPPLAPDEITLLPSQPHPLQDIRCSARDAADLDGDAVTIVYRWAKDDGTGTFVEDASQTDAILPADVTAPGDTWRCYAAGDDGRQVGEALFLDSTVREDLEPLSLADLRMDGPPVGAFGYSAAWIDLDGDGGADTLALGSQLSGAAGQADTGVIYLFAYTSLRGGSIAFGDADAILRGGVGDRLGSALRSAPDITGDGVPELLALADGSGSGPLATRGYVAIIDPTTIVVSGTPAPITDVASFLTTPPAAPLESYRPAFGPGFAAGDFNNDGVADLIAAQDYNGVKEGRVWHAPNAALQSQSSVITLAPAVSSVVADSSADLFGSQLDASGDFTGDGLPDLIVGTVRTGSSRIAALIYSGAQLGGDLAEADAVVSLAHNTGADAGAQAGFLPDLDGDGDDEAWISIPGFGSDLGRVGIFFGQSTAADLDFLNTDQNIVLEGDQAGDRFGEHVVVLGDLGSDGLPELAVSAPGSASGTGRVYIFSGATLAEAAASYTAGVPSVISYDQAAWTLLGEANGDALTVIAPGGDLDGDGYLDIILGAEGAGSGDGRVYAWFSNR